MLNLQLGPLALPLNPLLMLAGWWLASALADRLARGADAGTQRGVARAMMLAAALGLLTARAGFVALAWPFYLEEPLSMLNLRDGGWMPWAGLCAALGVLGGYAWRQAGMRRPLLAGAAGGLVLWGGVSTALGVHARPALPAISLDSLDGPAVALAAQPGAAMVINLWATWCAPCRIEMPYLAQAQRDHPGVRFVFVNQGEATQAVRSWIQQQPYSLQNVLLDPRQSLMKAMGSSGLPTTIFVDHRGRVIERHFGPLSAASLAGRLRALD
jgi:thiol-disulfide isomerase/thioredoxin